MKKFLLLGTSIFALLLSACGGGGGKDDDPPEPGPDRELDSLSARYSGEVDAGNTLNINYLSVTAKYSDNTTSEVKNKCDYYIDSQKITISSYVFNTAGDIGVTAKYEGLSANFTVKVNSSGVQPQTLNEFYFETKQVFDGAGAYTLVVAYQFNDQTRKVSLNKVQDGLYKFNDTFGIKGDFRITATNKYGTLINQLDATVATTGNLLVIDTLTTSHWATYSTNYVPVRPTSLSASYQGGEAEQGSKIDYDKLTVNVNCNDESSITVNDYKLYYMSDYSTKVYINDDFTFGYRFNVGYTYRIYVEGYNLTTSFEITITHATHTLTVYLNALCGFDFDGNVGIFASIGEEGSSQDFKMEKVGSFKHVYAATVSYTTSSNVSFKVASKYSAQAQSYLFTLHTEKMYMSEEFNMFGVAEIDYETKIARGPLHQFDENFDYENDVVRNVSYDGWLTSLRGNLTYRQRLYDNRTHGLQCDEIYYQNGENERRIDRIDDEGNVFDSYYIRSIFGHRYMYFIEGDIRRIEENESESFWWRDSDDYRYTVNFHHHYTAGGMVDVNIDGFNRDILNYIDDPEHFMGGNVINEGYQECYIKFENYQLKELIYINGDNVFYFSDFSNWDNTIPEPLNIPFGFHLNTEWFNVSYTIYNQNDEEVGSGYTDYYLQFANYELNVKQAYDELDVFGEENIYYYVIFSTTDNGRGDSVTTAPYYLNNVNVNEYKLDEVYLNVSYDGVVSECDLPPNQTAG
ncbi:MAG: hypothetical protein IJQ72_05595 [Bacilli bacterium]|nr:hypothetical protein [Bacilli bacterium]